MTETPSTTPIAAPPLDVITRLLHLGLAVFGVWSWLDGLGWIGAGASDYDNPVYSGYIQHRWVGIVFTVFLLARILWGFVGPASVRFVNWVPWTPARLKVVVDDVRSLLRLRVPEHPAHVGLSGFVEALGLLAFLWLGLSGLLSAFTITPGIPVFGWLHVVKHWHQIGNVLVPAYLILHVGGTVAHSIVGKQVWKKMLFLK
ncbi:cytochrome b/b6 domain-containing protein [Pusillimonas sp. ANT_WB101]|uniref:cytochrome b/b6 domain-containing protein n=1 Tax=Pusillimonas sp. ANT_WB101 TaxID=2597356 RepID=UPI00165E254F|nr:cytochrome b/b6 domain-containing protein [Pusillimonas sp. ANT_WB101]